MARPIPPADPVMTAVRPCNLIGNVDLSVAKRDPELWIGWIKADRDRAGKVAGRKRCHEATRTAPAPAEPHGPRKMRRT